MIAAHLTIEQKELLVNKEFAIDSYFNPIQDINDSWIISLEEIEQCDKVEFQWVKDLPLIQCEPKTSIEAFGFR